MSILQKLTEGVQSRDMRAEGTALLNKWEATGLLEGLNGESQKQGMAVLLENQAKELLREASSMAAGDVEGFAAVAFPIVRRVFGGLIANDLVSVQPMSLPSGLIFFLDFTHSTGRLGAVQNDSLYGGNVVGSQITGGVDLDPSDGSGPNGFYNLGHGDASPTGSTGDPTMIAIAGDVLTELGGTAVTNVTLSDLTAAQKKAIRFDADILAMPAATKVGVYQSTNDIIGGSIHTDFDIVHSGLGAATAEAIDTGKLSAFTGTTTNGAVVIRRLTRIVKNKLVMVIVNDDDINAAAADAPSALSVPLKDNFVAGGAAGSIVGTGPFGLEEPDHRGSRGNDGSKKVGADTNDMQSIAEIDIKVDSIAVTAQTKKLKAKWSPELGQDLNAYHNLDAEVELTGILSEQIALEIDRELLGELVQGATAGTRYWSRAPGLFVSSTGAELGAAAAAPDFTGTVSEWYETLIETINDVSAQIHRKTLRGGANFVVCSPEVANILEFTSGFRASVTADQDRGTIGAVKAGSLSKKFDVYVDPYFLRNVILIGRKGSSFLESGFVYAPYVPLQVTPTIFGTEDFVPRKGVMTRYAKKMVRPDMYGLVVVRGLLGEEGSS
jgi:hypothetical protein